MWLLFWLGCSVPPLAPASLPVNRADGPLSLRVPEDIARVQSRIAELLTQEAPPPLEIRIEADLPFPRNLSWGNLEESPPLDITVDGGGHLLSGVQLRIEGRRVRVERLRMDGAGRGGQLLEIVGAEEILLKELILKNTPEAPSGKGARVPVGALRLTAARAGVRARVQRLLLLDHRAAGAVRMGGRGGGAGFSEVLWEEGRAAAVALPLFNLGEVTVFSAPGTLLLGSGQPLIAMPGTVILEEPELLPEDSALLADWRAER